MVRTYEHFDRFRHNGLQHEAESEITYSFVDDEGVHDMEFEYIHVHIYKDGEWHLIDTTEDVKDIITENIAEDMMHDYREFWRR